jgi:hypothetical protein
MVTPELALLREVCLSRNTLRCRCGIQASAEALKATRWASLAIPFILDFLRYKIRTRKQKIFALLQKLLGDDDAL